MTLQELHHSRIYRVLREELLKTYGYVTDDIEEKAWEVIGPYERARSRAASTAAEMTVAPLPNPECIPFPGWWEPPFPGQEAA